MNEAEWHILIPGNTQKVVYLTQLGAPLGEWLAMLLDGHKPFVNAKSLLDLLHLGRGQPAESLSQSLLVDRPILIEKHD